MGAIFVLLSQSFFPPYQLTHFFPFDLSRGRDEEKKGRRKVGSLLVYIREIYTNKVYMSRGLKNVKVRVAHIDLSQIVSYKGQIHDIDSVFSVVDDKIYVRIWEPWIICG